MCEVLRFLTSVSTVEPATLFSHSSVPRVLCAWVLVEKSTDAGGKGATAPSRGWEGVVVWVWAERLCWETEIDGCGWDWWGGWEEDWFCWAEDAACCWDAAVACCCCCFLANRGGSLDPPPPLPFSPELFLPQFYREKKQQKMFLFTRKVYTDTVYI